VTVGEDPAFGHEYLSSCGTPERRSAMEGLLRGHFEFGTMSLNKPSLILVRNQKAAGTWRGGCAGKRIPRKRERLWTPSPVAQESPGRIEFDEGE